MDNAQSEIDEIQALMWRVIYLGIWLGPLDPVQVNFYTLSANHFLFFFLLFRVKRFFGLTHNREFVKYNG